MMWFWPAATAVSFREQNFLPQKRLFDCAPTTGHRTLATKTSPSSATAHRLQTLSPFQNQRGPFFPSLKTSPTAISAYSLQPTANKRAFPLTSPTTGHWPPITDHQNIPYRSRKIRNRLHGFTKANAAVPMTPPAKSAITSSNPAERPGTKLW